MKPTSASAISAGLFRALTLLAALVFFTASGGTSLAARFTVSVDRASFTLGEQVTLSLTFEGGEPKQLPSISVSGLQLAYIGQSSQMNIINGAVSSTVSHNFAVSAQRTGSFTVPELTVDVAGQRLASSPVQLTVVQPGSSVPSNSGENLLMLKLNIPKKEAFVGEALTIQLQLYVNSAIQNFGNFQITSFPASGFNVGKMAEGQHSRVQLGNSVYRMIPLNITVTPVRSDSLTVGPIAAKLIIEVPNPNRRRDAFDSFFFRNEQREVTLAADAGTINVLSLPTENVPPGFSGAIGKYELNLSASPTNVAAGDPITLKIQVTGRGNLDGLSLPDQPGWHEFKTYPPTARIETTDALGIEGTKSFEQVLVPQNSEIRLLPEFTFSFFDPEVKTYKTLKQPSIPLTVRPSGSVPGPTIAGQSASSDQPVRDVVPIKQRVGRLITASRPLLTQPQFIALQSIPALALAGAIVWRRRNESLANNPRLRRQRQVAQLVREGLEDLRKSAQANDSDAFFATVFRLLQEQLGERLDVPASSITEAVVDERLRPMGAPESTQAEVHELFQACNLARYAPIKSGHELAAFIPKVESALHHLQEVEA